MSSYHFRNSKRRYGRYSKRKSGRKRHSRTKRKYRSSQGGQLIINDAPFAPNMNQAVALAQGGAKEQNESTTLPDEAKEQNESTTLPDEILFDILKPNSLKRVRHVASRERNVPLTLSVDVLSKPDHFHINIDLTPFYTKFALGKPDEAEIPGERAFHDSFVDVFKTIRMAMKKNKLALPMAERGYLKKAPEEGDVDGDYGGFAGYDGYKIRKNELPKFMEILLDAFKENGYILALPEKTTDERGTYWTYSVCTQGPDRRVSKNLNAYFDTMTLRGRKR